MRSPRLSVSFVVSRAEQALSASLASVQSDLPLLVVDDLSEVNGILDQVKETCDVEFPLSWRDSIFVENGTSKSIRDDSISGTKPSGSAGYAVLNGDLQNRRPIFTDNEMGITYGVRFKIPVVLTAEYLDRELLPSKFRNPMLMFLDSGLEKHYSQMLGKESSIFNIVDVGTAKSVFLSTPNSPKPDFFVISSNRLSYARNLPLMGLANCVVLPKWTLKGSLKDLLSIWPRSRITYDWNMFERRFPTREDGLGLWPLDACDEQSQLSLISFGTQVGFFTSRFRHLGPQNLERRSPFVDPLHHSELRVCLTFDFEKFNGAFIGLPRILKALEELRVNATFFVTGEMGKLFPGRIWQITKSGHELALHGLYHEPLSMLKKEEQLKRLRAAKDLLEQVGNSRVEGFRAPAFFENSETHEAISDLGIRYDAFWPNIPFFFQPVSLLTQSGMVDLVPASLETYGPIGTISGLGAERFLRETLWKAMKRAMQTTPMLTILLHPFRDGIHENLELLRKLIRFIQNTGFCSFHTISQARATLSPKHSPETVVIEIPDRIRKLTYAIRGSPEKSFLTLADLWWVRYANSQSALTWPVAVHSDYAPQDYEHARLRPQKWMHPRSLAASAVSLVACLRNLVKHTIESRC